MKRGGNRRGRWERGRAYRSAGMNDEERDKKSESVADSHEKDGLCGEPQLSYIQPFIVRGKQAVAGVPANIVRRGSWPMYSSNTYTGLA